MGAAGTGTRRKGPSYILIAEVNRVRGLRGEVVATVHADDPGRMARLTGVFVRETDGAWREIRLQGVKRLHDRAVLKLEGYDSVEQARALVGKELFIPREASTPAPAGRYYAYQLEGLEVRLTDGRPVGTVREVLSQGLQSLLVVDGPMGEVLIPVTASICRHLDEEAGVLTIDPPEGLLEINRPATPRA
ncbi:MAG: ribosome maturation factor RimM [Candidatus Polarisedimenticolia bacterium]